MPRKTNSSPPPEVMTWGRAAFILVIAVVFDLLRLFFEMFWFFGPALAAVVCTVKAGGSAVAGVICTAVAGTVGFFGAGAIETFGVVMAIAVGVFGWLVVFLLLTMNNARIFKTLATSWLWSLFCLGVSVIPIVGSIPMITISVVRLYYAQIKKDQEKFKEWEKINKLNKDIQTKIMRAKQAADRVRQQQEIESESPDEIPEGAREAA